MSLLDAISDFMTGARKRRKRRKSHVSSDRSDSELGDFEPNLKRALKKQDAIRKELVKMGWDENDVAPVVYGELSIAPGFFSDMSVSKAANLIDSRMKATCKRGGARFTETVPGTRFTRFFRRGSPDGADETTAACIKRLIAEGYSKKEAVRICSERGWGEFFSTTGQPSLGTSMPSASKRSKSRRQRV